MKPLILLNNLHSKNNIFEIKYYEKLKILATNLNITYYSNKKIFHDNKIINYNIYDDKLLDVIYYYNQYLSTRNKYVKNFLKMNHENKYTKIIK